MRGGISPGTVKGMPSRLIFPVGTHHVQQMLELVGLTLVQRCDMLMCVLGTIMCMGFNVVDQLQICDVLRHFDAAFHVMYANTLACRIYKQKQDTATKGLYQWAGGAVFTRLRSYVNLIWLEKSAECSKGRSPSARCRTCMPLFPRIVNNAVTSDQLRGTEVHGTAGSPRPPSLRLALLGLRARALSGRGLGQGGRRDNRK